MKTIRVVAIIKATNEKESQLFSLHKEVKVSLKADGIFWVERLRKVKHHRKHLYER